MKLELSCGYYDGRQFNNKVMRSSWDENGLFGVNSKLREIT